MAAVEVRGVRFGYDDLGAGDPPFVFLHGWACDRTAWAPQVVAMSARHRCIAIDFRGRGESEAVAPYDTETQADDVAAIMRELGVGPAIVAGHSLGGLVALLLNDRHPDLVLGIVMGDSPLSSASSTGFAPLRKTIEDAGSMSGLDEVIEGMFVEATPEEVKAKVRATMLTCPPEVSAGMLSNGEVFTKRMGELLKKADEKPFMAIWGQRPRGYPERLREATRFLRQEPMGDAGHFFQLEQPEVTNALLRAFVDDVERDPRIHSPA